MSVALSLCQYVLRSSRGLAQASPGLAQASPSLKAPRLQAFEARDFLHQHNRKEHPGNQVTPVQLKAYGGNKNKKNLNRREDEMQIPQPHLRIAHANKTKLDDGWPESLEEQSLLLLVWRHFFYKTIY